MPKHYEIHYDDSASTIRGLHCDENCKNPWHLATFEEARAKLKRHLEMRIENLKAATTRIQALTPS